MKKIKLMVIVCLFITINGYAQSQPKIPSCDSTRLNTVFPCSVVADESDQILRTMMLNNLKALKRVANGPTVNPGFNQYRVSLLAEKQRPGHGPGTYRNRSVYKIQILIQSRDHGPAPGTEPSLLTVFVNELSSTQGAQTKYESQLKKLTNHEVGNVGNPRLEEIPVIETFDPTERMIAEGFEY